MVFQLLTLFTSKSKVLQALLLFSTILEGGSGEIDDPPKSQTVNGYQIKLESS